MAATEKDPEQLLLASKLNNVPRCEHYDAFVPDLANARFRARVWCHKYNNEFPALGPDADYDALSKHRMTQLRDILGAVEGNEVIIEPPFLVDYGCNIRVGDRFYANFNLTILDCGLVTIGDRVMFGPNVSIFAATHETEVQSRRDNVEFAKPVTIGDDCWIGGRVIILPGVTIGQGCTIGAGAVVTRDVPAWSVAMGSPARVVKTVTKLN
ncbi:acetyltransferase [Capronia epimyces CBS 606.96]|uniref:Acetyltransferase n=1 Tax=Capronia epimyces CBS 606.96 TaxID=1182542 RepID=W9XCG6_9EURO|nr:acetyltransferase [Capronia epimyces CBS 606.96]EXJ78187.1 acetyltransferase [Capronia epimyces CBS 606.96]